MFIVNKSKCMGCAVCVRNCPDGVRIGKDGKAEIIDQEKVAQCGGEKICPFDSIKEVSGSDQEKRVSSNEPWSLEQENKFGRGQGRGQGNGFGRRQGRGFGKGLGRRLGRGLGRGLRRGFRSSGNR